MIDISKIDYTRLDQLEILKLFIKGLSEYMDAIKTLAQSLTSLGA